MSRRPRGTVQDPVSDYLDTARPEQEKRRRCVSLATIAATAENTKFLSFAQAPTDRKEPAMTHSTATPPRPANIPPRFAPVPNPLNPREVGHFEADARTAEHLAAFSVVDADGRRGVRYFLRLNLEDATATEVRDALAAALEWWTVQEAHLDAAEVSR